MKFSRSYKSKKRKYLELGAAALIVILLVGWSTKAYSPAHIGHYAIPIPILIPIIHSSGSDDKASTSNAAAVQQTAGQTSPAPSFNHLGITTTYFWVGEPADSDNGYIANSASAWDSQWQKHFGGQDAPSPRTGYLPAGFTPKENSFYFALPYNDIDNKGKRKVSAASCPLAPQKTNYSWCKNSWIAIRHNGKVVYAQWEDVGPFGEDDPGYVFGSSPPQNKQGAKAGLDVSPAIRDYLGLQDVDKTDWAFVDASKVPSGPWRTTVTTTPGEAINN